MSGLTCVQVHDAAPEFALGVLGGAERAEVIVHLTNCSRCQAYVAELTEAADVLPLMVPEREPPAGFEQRVLEGLHADRRRSRRRWFASVAVAVAAATILSITILRVIDARTDTTRVATTPATELATAPMVSAVSGAPAGWAYVSDHRNVVLAVAYGVDAGRYDIQVASAAGSPAVIGGIDIVDSRGSWVGASSVPIATGDTISLIDAQGAAVCHGTVETTQ
ncbi:MAG TPA: zf-HC2 domain-containing protein [Acidimicrobiia bacterium]|nr:zf-HC2 domain-containing protein [Acidimicrobiia bacterium]